MAIGGLIGQKINLEMKFSHIVIRFSKGNLSEGLSTAILLFCIGSLSILGPVEAALKGDLTYLFANGMLDGITSIVLASTFGLGIAFSALVLFCWQGSIYLIAKLIENSLNTDLMNEVTIIGGILILCSGLSILGIKKFKTLNLLPSLAIPPLMFLIIFVFNL
ncbi:putative membrane protein YdfK [compost metagenome]